ncbi:hypothetical protein N9H19_00400 [Flavobacteriales bacterium]|nr:hypothetical protein [Flavobacteriales bacterium]
MIKEFIAFKLRLFLFLLAAYFIHFFIIKNHIDPVLNNMLNASYLGNLIITAAVFFVLTFLKEKQAKNLGFIFLFTSLFKFAFFYYLLQPTFQADGLTTKLEFFLFFVPYSLSLTIEVTALVKTLNKQH